MSARVTAGRLVRTFPPAWRARYGEELASLIVEMSGEARVPWSVRLDVLRAGARERARGGADGPQRGRDGALLVLWAWALFVVAGAMVAKTSEHWRAAMPAGSHAVATGAFDVLVAAAVLAAVLVATGIAVTVGALRASWRDGGWRTARRTVAPACALTAVLAAASIALVAWANSLSAAADRDGADTGYAVVYCAWALLGAGTLAAWTRAATTIARTATLSAGVLALVTRLAVVVSLAMGAMLAATGCWWASVAHVRTAALTGGGAGSAFVAQLALAGAMMLGATGLGAVGARRAATGRS